MAAVETFEASQGGVTKSIDVPNPEGLPREQLAPRAAEAFKAYLASGGGGSSPPEPAPTSVPDDSTGSTLQAGASMGLHGLGTTMKVAGDLAAGSSWSPVAATGKFLQDHAAGVRDAVPMPANYADAGEASASALREGRKMDFVKSLPRLALQGLPQMAAVGAGGLAGGLAGPYGAAAGAGLVSASMDAGTNLEGIASRNGETLDNYSPSSLAKATALTGLTAAANSVGMTGGGKMIAKLPGLLQAPARMAREGLGQAAVSGIQQEATTGEIDPANTAVAGIAGTLGRGAMEAPGAGAKGLQKGLKAATDEATLRWGIEAPKTLEEAQSVQRVNDAFKTQKELEKGSSVPASDTAILNNIHGNADAVLTSLLRQARDGGFITQDQLRTDFYPALEGATRHNNTLSPNDPSLQRIKSWALPDAEKTQIIESLRDINTVSDAHYFKTATGPLERALGLAGRVGGVGYGLATGNFAGAAMAAAGSGASKWMGSQVGRGLDKVFGLQTPDLLIRGKSADRNFGKYEGPGLNENLDSLRNSIQNNTSDLHDAFGFTPAQVAEKKASEAAYNASETERKVQEKAQAAASAKTARDNAKAAAHGPANTFNPDDLTNLQDLSPAAQAAAIAHVSGVEAGNSKALSAAAKAKAAYEETGRTNLENGGRWVEQDLIKGKKLADQGRQKAREADAQLATDSLRDREKAAKDAAAQEAVKATQTDAIKSDSLATKGSSAAVDKLLTKKDVLDAATKKAQEDAAWSGQKEPPKAPDATDSQIAGNLADQRVARAQRIQDGRTKARAMDLQERAAGQVEGMAYKMSPATDSRANGVYGRAALKGVDELGNPYPKDAKGNPVIKQEDGTFVPVDQQPKPSRRSRQKALQEAPVTAPVQPPQEAPQAAPAKPAASLAPPIAEPGTPALKAAQKAAEPAPQAEPSTTTGGHLGAGHMAYAEIAADRVLAKNGHHGTTPAELVQALRDIGKNGELGKISGHPEVAGDFAEHLITNQMPIRNHPGVGKIGEAIAVQALRNRGLPDSAFYTGTKGEAPSIGQKPGPQVKLDGNGAPIRHQGPYDSAAAVYHQNAATMMQKAADQGYTRLAQGIDRIQNTKNELDKATARENLLAELKKSRSALGKAEYASAQAVLVTTGLLMKGRRPKVTK